MTGLKRMADRAKVALPWTRHIAGFQRGWVERHDRGGTTIARTRSAAEKAALDARLRAAGYIVIDAPKGCEFEPDRS